MRRSAFLFAALALAAAGGAYVLRPRPEGLIDPYTGHFELGPEVRRHLWQTEQRAFLLSGVLRQLAKALRDGQPDAWRGALAPRFRGEVFAGAGARETIGDLRVETWDGSASVRAIDGDAFLEWLLALRRPFAGPPEASFHLALLRPRHRSDPAGPCDGTFEISLRGGLAEGGKHSLDIFCSFSCDRSPADGDEGWLAAVRTASATACSAPDFLMAEATERSGIDTLSLFDRWTLTPAEAAGATGWLSSHLLDFDRDGRLDLLFCDRRLRLYRGLGDGRFEEVTRAADLETLRGFEIVGGTVADFDNDGDEDLLADGGRGTEGRTFAFENRGDGTFRERADLRKPGVGISHGAVADYDGDGLVDLYVRTAGKRPAAPRARWIGDRTAAEGVLLKNLGDWRFEDVTERAGALSEHRDIFAAAWLDADTDGDPDLLLANHMGDNVLLENLGDGTFARHGVQEGFGGFSMGLAVGDLDGDGDPDAFLANMSSHAGSRIIDNLRPEDYPEGVFPLIRGFVQGNVALENLGHGGGFRERAVLTGGWAYGPALIDLDGDGALDVYCPAGFQSVQRGKPDG